MNDFVKFLRDTSPYINRHRGKTFVLAFSGEAVAHANFNNIIHDISLLHHLGIKLVLVHGTRFQLEARLAASGWQVNYHDNRLITDETAMTCAKEAAGNVRMSIEALLSTDLANSPMAGAEIRVTGGNFITAKPVGIKGGVDFGHTGEVRRIDKDAIQQQLDNDAIVLLSPIGYSPTGEVFNLDYPSIAAQTAIALGADKLMMFTPEAGVESNNGLQKTLALHEVANLLQELDPQRAVYPSLQACYQAGNGGVPRGHIISHTIDGTLLTELFTLEGRGTLILENRKEVIRQATIDDVGGILDLITPLEEQDILVKRSRELLENEITQFYVLVHSEGNLAACAALYPFADDHAAELACVATHPDFKDRGFGTRLLEHVEKTAKSMNIKQLFVLTTQTAHWFQQLGFAPATLEELPAKKQSLYNWQRNSKIFRKQLR